MKKQVVAVVLSLAMSMTTAAEAGIVSAADFSAEAATSETTDTAEVSTVDDSEDITGEDDSQTADADTAQPEVVPEEDNTDTADTQDAEVDFTSDAEVDTEISDTQTAAVVTEETPEAAGASKETSINDNQEGGQEAKLYYTRWEPDNAKNPTKWKLHKIEKTTAKEATVQTAGNDDSADAADISEENTEVSEDETAIQAAVEENGEAGTVEEQPSAEGEQTSDADSGQLAQADETTDADAEVTQVTEDIDTQAAGASATYYTSADGLVKITTMKADGTELFTGYYAFDKDGYLITGRSLVGSNTMDYYYFTTADETTITKTDITSSYKTPYNSALGQMVQNAWRWNAADGVFNYYNPKQEVFDVNKVYQIDGDYYYLLKDGKPYVGDKYLTYNNKKGTYMFRTAASATDIPGKMVRNGWAGRKTSRGTQWRYFDANGVYQKKGIGAYKLRTDTNNLYLVDANGYLIRNKMVKAANGYYYLSNNGAVVYREKLVKYGNYRYYFVSDGRRATWKNRWVKCKGAGNRYYYFGKTAGRVQEQKGIKKVTVNGKFIGWFQFSSKGNSLMNYWTGGRYYLPDGRMANGLTKVNGKYYFFKRSSSTKYYGKMYKNQWIKWNNKYYYASADGTLYSNGWKYVKSDGKNYWFYFQKDCTVMTNKSVTKNGKKGIVDSRGRFISAGWFVYNDSKNLVRYVDSKTGKLLKNCVRWIDGKQYRFDKYGNRVNDRTSEYRRSSYYLECDRVNGVMTVYTDSTKTIPIKTIRVSVGNPITLTSAGTYTLSRSLRWQPLMGPSWGQYGTHVDGCGQGGIFVHSVACSQKNDHNLPVGEYLKLGNPASHGCIRCCVADAKWVYDNCNGSTIHIMSGTYQSQEVFKGPLGRNRLTPLRGNKTFDPTDPAYANK